MSNAEPVAKKKRFPVHPREAGGLYQSISVSASCYYAHNPNSVLLAGFSWSLQHGKLKDRGMRVGPPLCCMAVPCAQDLQICSV